MQVWCVYVDYDDRGPYVIAESEKAAIKWIAKRERVADGDIQVDSIGDVRIVNPMYTKILDYTIRAVDVVTEIDTPHTSNT